MFSEERIRKVLYASVGLLLLFAAVFLFFRYLFGALLPFLIAYAIAYCLQPLVRAMEKRAGISRKATVLAAVCLIVALLIFVCTVAVRRVSKELTSLAETLGAFLERVRNDPSYADELADVWAKRLPFLDMHAVFADLDGRLTALLTSLAGRLSESVLPFLANLAASLPCALLSVAVLGTGTVLLPWAAFCFAAGDTKSGVGLLIVYAVITVVRQILEPRIVGKYIGLPPLASLASMYIGLKLIGFWGLFLFPVGALLAYHTLYKKEPSP